jgi:hypothetical protein
MNTIKCYCRIQMGMYLTEIIAYYLFFVTLEDQNSLR